MSVRTPILTTSSEICAFATVPKVARARPAASAVVVRLIVSSPWLLLRLRYRFSIGLQRTPQRPKQGTRAAPSSMHRWDENALKRRQGGHGNIDCALRLRDHAQRF